MLDVLFGCVKLYKDVLDVTVI